jgi:hypothetical protein
MSAGLRWHRDGADWVLLAGRRRFGRVVPDGKYPGMWRSVLSGGRLSDMANLAWSKNAVLLAAEREMDWEQRTAIASPKSQENELAFGQPSPSIAQIEEREAADRQARQPARRRPASRYWRAC